MKTGTHSPSIRRKIVIAAGTGFLGRSLTRWFQKHGDEVVVLTRRNAGDLDARQVLWDSETAGMDARTRRRGRVDQSRRSQRRLPL